MTARRLLSKEKIRIVGSDPAEYRGPDTDDANPRILAQVEQIAGQMSFGLTDPEGYQEGDVGWVADQITVGTAEGDVPFRFTGVVHKEDGHWRLVQVHFSELPT